VIFTDAPDITDEPMLLAHALESDALRLAARKLAAAEQWPHANEPFVGPFPINEDSEP
jgi:hypothetical protein